ncbi:MAG: hypothetical protein HQK66_14430 [Desulfamplus sp.]|nr:hypothetical protein [Desulfamplus sp.]
MDTDPPGTGTVHIYTVFSWKGTGIPFPADDTKNAGLFQSFGTYGHSGATASWEGFDAFEFDIKTDTEGRNHTRLLILLSDNSGNIGKPAFDDAEPVSNMEGLSGAVPMKSYSDNLSLQDGVWQTVRIPLDGRFFDWRYPRTKLRWVV